MLAENYQEQVKSFDSHTGTILIFPIDIDSARQFAITAKSLNLHVIAASSINKTRPDLDYIDDFIYLPYVNHPDFNQCLFDTLDKCNITHVFSPHAAVWNHLNQLNKEILPGLKFHLCTPEPFAMDWQQYSTSYDFAHTFQKESIAENLGLFGVRKRLSTAEYAGLHNQFISIPGQCDEIKLFALIEIFKVIPAGDIVEIGVLYGRSAYVLGKLSDRYNIGSVICVDPWQYDLIEKQGEEAKLLNQQLNTINSKNVFDIFKANISLIDCIRYIRHTSEDAYQVYKNMISDGVKCQTNQNTTQITGNISLLHIDGNHKYEEVSKDVEIWEPDVMSGGWILIDDYLWAFGDGPRKKGDELLTQNKFDMAFCLGDTLFLRKS